MLTTTAKIKARKHVLFSGDETDTFWQCVKTLHFRQLRKGVLGLLQERNLYKLNQILHDSFAATTSAPSHLQIVFLREIHVFQSPEVLFGVSEAGFPNQVHAGPCYTPSGQKQDFHTPSGHWQGLRFRGDRRHPQETGEFSSCDKLRAIPINCPTRCQPTVAIFCRPFRM